MPTRLCDRCGQLIDEGALRYIAKIQVYAAYDPPLCQPHYVTHTSGQRERNATAFP